MKTTNTYHCGKLVRKEKLATVMEFVEMGRLEPGQKLIIGESNDAVYETLYVGNCTIYEQPSCSSEDGWACEHPRAKKFVLEIHTWS